MLILFISLVKVQNLVSKYSQTKRGELKVMLTHSDWHDFTLSVLKCKEVMKIYRDHPYGLKPYHFVSPYCFILHNNLYTYISYYWHMHLNKYAYNTVHICSTALLQ